MAKRDKVLQRGRASHVHQQVSLAGLFRAGRWGALCVAIAHLTTNTASAETVVLYSNNFEAPQTTFRVAAGCSRALDRTDINTVYGDDEVSFINNGETVETVDLMARGEDGELMYTGDIEGHGRFAVGMLATVIDDRLAITFDTGGLEFLNVGISLAAIGVEGCGPDAPFFMGEPARMSLQLLDTPDLAEAGTQFSWDNVDSYEVLATGEARGAENPEMLVFHWNDDVVSLDASGATNNTVTLTFDLLEGGYAVFDNLSITTSTEEDVVDSDQDGVADDVDPEPNDERICGDADMDGTDDCGGIPPEEEEPTGEDPGSAPDAGNPEPGNDEVDAGIPAEDEAPATDNNGDADGDSSGSGDSGGGCSVALAPGQGGSAAGIFASPLLLLTLALRRRGRKARRR